MGKFYTFLFIIILIIFADLAYFNTDSVTINVFKDISHTMPKIAFIIISSASGAIFMFFIYFIRDTRRFITAKQIKKSLKKEEQINVYYAKAINYMLGQKIDEAIIQFNDALKENPQHFSSLLKLGDIYLQREEFSKAEEYYLKARSVDKENIELIFKLSRLKETTNKLNEAIDLIEEILNIDRGNLAALYKKRELMERLSKWDELIYIQQSIIEVKPNKQERAFENDLLIGYKYEYAAQILENKEFEKAEKTFKEIVKLDQSFLPAYLGLTEIMLNKGNTEEAISYLEKTHEQTKSIVLLVRLEDLIINLGEPSRLIQRYRNSIEKDPGNSLLKLFQAKLYYRLEMLDDAMDVLNSIDTGTETTPPEIHKLKGAIYLKREQHKNAVDELLYIIDIKKTLRIPYKCSNCGYISDKWSCRCPSCKQWNTFSFNYLQ